MHEYKYTNTMHEYKYTNTHAHPSSFLCKAVHVTQCNANQLQRKSEKFQPKYKDFTEQCTEVILDAVSNTPFNCIVRVAIVGSDSSQMRTNGSWVQTPWWTILSFSWTTPSMASAQGTACGRTIFDVQFKMIHCWMFIAHLVFSPRTEREWHWRTERSFLKSIHHQPTSPNLG